MSANSSSQLVDAHCHVASTDFTPRSFLDGALKNVQIMRESVGLSGNPTQLRDQYLATLQDHHCDELVREMDESNIVRAVLLLPDFTYALRDCQLTIAEMFARHAAILARHPGRFEVFAGVDPRWGKDAVDLFERGVDHLGFRGLKLYPPCGYQANDPSLFPLYELCQARQLPVLVHIGPTSPALRFSPARPCFVDEAAFLFPKVPFILAHATTAFTEECAELCAHRPNLYLDVSGFQSLEGRDPELHTLRSLLRRGICHKVLFGTDWPVFRGTGTQEEFSRRFLDVATAELGPAQLALVTRENAFRLLALSSTSASGLS